MTGWAELLCDVCGEEDTAGRRFKNGRQLSIQDMRAEARPLGWTWVRADPEQGGRDLEGQMIDRCPCCSGNHAWNVQGVCSRQGCGARQPQLPLPLEGG